MSNLEQRVARLEHQVVPSMVGMLHDVDTSTTPPVNGDALVNNGTHWVPGTVGAALGAYDRFVTPSTPVATYTLTFLPTGMIVVSQDGSMLAQGFDYTVNYTTGVITLAVTPTAGDVIAVAYETAGATVSLPSGGLIAWWRADTIGVADGAAVSNWTSFDANHWPATQTSGPNKPTYRAAPTGFNGQPAVEFAGGQELDVPFDAGLNPAGAMTIAAVVNHPNDGNTGFIFSSRDGTGGYLLTKTFNNHLTCLGADAGAAASPPTMWVVFDTDNAVTTADGYLNGTLGQTLTSTFTNQTGGAGAAIIGNDPNGGSPHPYTGYIAEIIVYDRRLSSTERGQLDSYLQAKYGL